MFYRNFLFGTDSGTADVISVSADDLYCPGKGYGFVTEENRREQELLKLPELNSGFDTFYWYQDAVLTCPQEDEFGCFLDSDKKLRELEEEAGAGFAGEHRRIPLCFKADVPCQGNYKVTITLKTREPLRDVMIFTGRRRLEFLGDIPGNTEFVRTMTVNVCDIVPRGQTGVYEDKTLDITVVADEPRISGLCIEEAVCPVIYIAGDSTVTDQSADYPYAPGTSYSGWGQMLSAYLNENTAISNHAHSGLTTDSFRGEGHYAVVEKYSRPGDYVLFQFGHNDQKLEELKAKKGYRRNLLNFIEECRGRKTYPVIVTPIARNSWKGNDGSYNDLLWEYGESCREIGRQTGVPVVDLHKLSRDFIVENGLEASKAYFFPNDFTHSNDYGAYYMARLVAKELVRVCGNHDEQSYRFLAECVTEGFGQWKPAEKIVLPEKPKIFESLINPWGENELLSEVENLEEPLDRVTALDMIIKTARFFPTNVYNDMFTDVVGHEWYAGTVECAYQNGIIDEHLVTKGRFCPEKPVTLEEFLIFAINGYKSRKTLPPEKPCAYDCHCRTFAVGFLRAACSIGLLNPDGSEQLDRVITRGEAVEICRKMKI